MSKRLVLGLLLVAACNASPPISTPTESASSDIDRLTHALKTATSAPALSIAIVQRGFVRYAVAEGPSDPSKHQFTEPATMFRIGSLSKLFTATALMRLAERKVIDLDSPIQRYVPEFPVKQAPITVRMLAGHLSGIRHYGPNEFINTAQFDSIAPTLAIFARDTLLFSPASKYFYSSYGYNLLGLAIERAAHKPYLQVIHDEVLGPLHMSGTAPDRKDSSIAHRAPLMAVDSVGRATPTVIDNLSDRWPSGGFLSTASDLARFGDSFTSMRLLLPETMRIMTTPQHLTTGAATIVGIGWRIGVDSAGRTIWHHAGSSNGGRSLLVVWPNERITVAIVANAAINLSPADAYRFAEVVRKER